MQSSFYFHSPDRQFESYLWKRKSPSWPGKLVLKILPHSWSLLFTKTSVPFVEFLLEISSRFSSFPSPSCLISCLILTRDNNLMCLQLHSALGTGSILRLALMSLFDHRIFDSFCSGQLKIHIRFVVASFRAFWWLLRHFSFLSNAESQGEHRSVFALHPCISALEIKGLGQTPINLGASIPVGWSPPSPLAWLFLPEN